MNLIIQDSESGAVLYGLVLLKQIVRTRRGAWAKVYRLPAEGWISFLQSHYRDIPEVWDYLKAVETEGINPREGALLEAIDDALEIPEEEFGDYLDRCGFKPDEFLESGEEVSEP
jgi:hypothetical protein